jgi:hypothetical protein
MISTLDFIRGIEFGFEFFDDEEDKISWFVLDLFIFRLMFGRIQSNV